MFSTFISYYIVCYISNILIKLYRSFFKIEMSLLPAFIWRLHIFNIFKIHLHCVSFYLFLLKRNIIDTLRNSMYRVQIP